MLDLILDALLDTAKLLPFLYGTYLVMEYLEHRLGEKSQRIMERAGRFGPLLGGVLGLAPQCGFSAAASSLYAGRVITLGTLFAVFLSTSDEMLPILISNRAPAALILKTLGLKALIGVAVGFLVDLLWSRNRERQSFHHHCEDSHCGCGEHGIFRAALHHTAGIALFIVVLTFFLNLLMYFIGQDTLAQFMQRRPALGVLLSALVGLIPNCGASVALTTLYLDGVLSFGAMMAGLLPGAGVGLLVLFRTNHSTRENLRIVLTLYLIGVAAGGLLEWGLGL